MNLIIPHDKAMHVCYGAAASVAGLLVAPLIFPHPMAAAVGAVAAAAALGIGKEAFDAATKRGTPSVPDALVTVAGGVPAALGAWL
jgi:hypothetical protein